MRESMAASRWRSRCTIVGVILLLIAGRPAWAGYTVVDLLPSSWYGGSIAGASDSQQVGTCWTQDQLYVARACVWSSTAASCVSLHPDAYTQTLAHGTDGSHQVGEADLVFPGNVWQRHAVVWSGSAASMVDIHPSACAFSYAWGLGGGQIVGDAAVGDYDHAALWTGISADDYIDLHPAGFAYSVAYATNGSIQVGTAQTSGGSWHAMLWSGSAASAVDLTPAGAPNGAVTAISGDQKVGYTNYHAMLWSGSGNAPILLQPSGYLGSYASAVCGNVQVGYAYSTTASGYHAVAWTGSADSVVDLHTYLGSDFTWSHAVAVDSTGRISGYAQNAGLYHPVMWIPTADLTTPTQVTARIGQTATLSARLMYGVSSVSGQRLHFTVGSDTAGDATTDANGIASLTYLVSIGPGPGNRTITVTDDSGDSANGTLVATGTATDLTVPAVSGRIGQTVTLRATLTGGGTPLAGETISFTVDGNPVLSAPTTDSSGLATVTYSIPVGSGPGPRTIQADFGGDSSYLASSGTGTLTVQKGIINFSLCLVYGAVGQMVGIKSLVICGGQPVSGCTVAFAVEGVPAGSGLSDSTGASISYKIPASLGYGWHNVTVSLTVDPDYVATPRTSAALWVRPNVALSLYAVTAQAGHPVVLRTLVYAAGAPVSGLPVWFSVDSKLLGPALSTSTGAAYAWTVPASMSPGVHNVTVSFAGSTLYNAASRTTAALTVTAPKGNVLFSLYAARGTPGSTVTLKTLVLSGGATLVGKTVAFAVDGAPAGSAISGASGALVGYTIPAAMQSGPHDVTVSFAGDSGYNPASRTTAALVVK